MFGLISYKNRLDALSATEKQLENEELPIEEVLEMAKTRCLSMNPMIDGLFVYLIKRIK